MGHGSCTAEAAGWGWGVGRESGHNRRWAVSGQSTAWEQLFTRLQVPEVLAFLAGPWCFTTHFPMESIDGAQNLNVKSI